MASKVGVLEQKLTADLEFDHLAHAQAQRDRERRGFFHEVRHMSATVTQMRDQQQQHTAQASVLRGEVLDDGTLHPALEPEAGAAGAGDEGEKKSKACVVQ